MELECKFRRWRSTRRPWGWSNAALGLWQSLLAGGRRKNRGFFPLLTPRESARLSEPGTVLIGGDRFPCPVHAWRPAENIRVLHRRMPKGPRGEADLGTGDRSRATRHYSYLLMMQIGYPTDENHRPPSRSYPRPYPKIRKSHTRLAV